MLFDIDLNTWPVVRDLYRIERKTVWQHADHHHILVVICFGSCLFTIDNTDYPVSAGDLFLIPQGQDYIRRPLADQPCTFCYIHFTTAGPLVACTLDTARRQLLVQVEDDTGSCELRFFSFYPSHQKTLAVGNRLRIRGEVKGGFWGRQKIGRAHV